MTRQDLLKAATEGGDLTPADRAEIEAAFLAAPLTERLPWYHHAFITLGAWISAAFGLAFVGGFLGELIFGRTGVGPIVVGALGIAAAVVLRRHATALYLQQLCLALSVAGHVCLLLGVGTATDLFFPVVLLSSVLAAVLYHLYQDALHRYLSCLSALSLWIAWIYVVPEGRTSFSTAIAAWLYSLQTTVMWLLHLVALWFVFAWPPAWRSLRPLGYAVATSLVGLCLLPILLSSVGFREAGGVHGIIILPAALGAILLSGAELSSIRRQPQLWGVALVGLVLVAFGQGLPTLTALMLVTLGYRTQERGLQVLGMLLIPAFTALHYYYLGTTLLEKAVRLMGTGAGLIVLALIALRWSRNPEEAA